ncbi:MAG: diguanylate cyclase [Nitrosomonadales bacterium]|nr:diguanylate cyclase [Nitrosomonadales bacterium]
MTLLAAVSWLFFAAFNLIDNVALKGTLDEARYESVSLLSAIVDAETGQRGYLITNNVAFLEPYNHARIHAAQAMAKLSVSAKDIAELKPIVANLHKLIDEKFRIIESTLQIQLNAGSYAPHLALTKDHGREVMDKIRAELNTTRMVLNAREKQVHDQINTRLKQAVTGAVLLLLVMIGILLFAYHRTVYLFDQNIKAQKIADRLDYQAGHDALTDIPNRRNFEQTLKRVFAMSARNKESFGLLYLDLDGFKKVNDQYGHDVGDDALIEVIERFTVSLRESDFLARIGGDEFALIVQNVKERAELELLANRIIQSLHADIVVSGHKFRLGVSIGVACYPSDARATGSLVAKADAAMYRAKEAGRNRVYFAT